FHVTGVQTCALPISVRGAGAIAAARHPQPAVGEIECQRPARIGEQGVDPAAVGTVRISQPPVLGTKKRVAGPDHWRALLWIRRYGTASEGDQQGRDEGA